MGEIPTDEQAFGVGVCGYCGNVQELARVEVDARQEDQGRGVCVEGNGVEDVLRGEVVGVRVRWLDEDECVVGCVSVVG